MKHIIISIMAIIMLFTIMACTPDTTSKETDTTEYIDTDANSESTETKRPNDFEYMTLDYTPSVAESIMRGFGIELDVSDMRTNAEEIEAGTNKNGWFKMYGEMDIVASILMREYTFGDLGVVREWNGENIISGLNIHLSGQGVHNNESLISTHSEDWKDLQYVGDIQSYVFETDTVYWMCHEMQNEEHDDSLVIYILPKDNQFVDSSKGTTIYHGIEMVINVNGVNSLFLGKPNHFISEEQYTTLSDALYQAWSIKLPAYSTLVVPE